MPPGRVIRLARITRAMVRADRDMLFVFGDNMEQRGFGGQAAAMRGEPNAIGVPTKWRPGLAEEDYFTDADVDTLSVLMRIGTAFAAMQTALLLGRNVVIPADGIGTGLAQLPTRAPHLHAAIERRIGELG